MKTIRLALAVLFVALVLVGCGPKATPEPPQVVEAIFAEELTDEMEIFDEGEELVGREAEGVEQKRTFRGAFAPMTERDVDVKGQSLRRDMRLEMTRPTSQALLTIPELIEALEMYREQLTVRADSLREKAAWFYEKATEGQR